MSLFVRPARQGLIVPMPERDFAHMPATGATIDDRKPYWRRLLKDGDVVRSRRARPAKPKNPNPDGED